METAHPDRFVRLPTELLEALWQIRLSGVQWRILLWVIRQTYGWDRQTASFSWYRIARQIRSSRSQAHSEGRRLLGAGILGVNDVQIGIQSDVSRWHRSGSGNRMAAEPNVRDSERFSFGNQDRTVRSPGPFRPENRTFFHRAKERCKEKERKKETRACASKPDPAPSEESSNPLVRVMDFYGAFRGSTLKEERTKIFDLELAKAATALLAACGQNADEAIQVIERIGKDLQQEGQPWTLETICRYRRYSALMNSCDRENAAFSKLDDRPTIQEEIP